MSYSKETPEQFQQRRWDAEKEARLQAEIAELKKENEELRSENVRRCNKINAIVADLYDEQAENTRLRNCVIRALNLILSVETIHEAKGIVKNVLEDINAKEL
jgi:hypothetical protein